MAPWIALALLLLCLMPLRAQASPFAAVVMDARTGEILHATNHTTRLHPASLTKMMTLYVTFEAIRNGEISLDTRVRVSRRAATEVPSRLGLREGQRIALRYLIRAAALRSGNDAATAIAEAVSGSVEAFATRMNRTAAAIGMTQTNFRNAHGLTAAGHLSTARDMTLLGRQLYFDFPEYYNIFSRRSEDAGIAHVNNTNSRFLNGYRGADGIKTGFTRAAGYNLTAMAERNGVRIVVTVFGGRSVIHRHEQIVALMDRGFRAAPNRVAVRRPSRPDYARVASNRSTASSTAQAAPTQGRSAGRVIRLQTAPARSIFPLARPSPDTTPAPSEALLAAVQSGVETVLAEVVAPAAQGDPDMPDAEPVARVRGAPARSLLPQARPPTVLARAGTDAAPTDTAAAQIAAAEAVGFTVIAPEALAALTATVPEPRPETEPEPELATRLAQADPDPVDAIVAETTAELPARAQEPPAERPAALALAAEPAPTQTEPPADITTAAGEPAAPETAPSETAAPPLLAEAEATPADIDAEAGLAAVHLADGQLVIPGLPPIPVQDTDSAPAETALAAAALPDPDAGPDAAPGLVVTESGQILWRHEDLLQGIDEVAEALNEPGRILLTAEDTPAPRPAPAAVMPEIVVRVSSSGNQLWAVDLGRFGSRFDAERTLLRVALAESGTLGGGVRRVVDGGGYRAMILGLSQDQAERACLRLETVAQPCNVVDP